MVMEMESTVSYIVFSCSQPQSIFFIMFFKENQSHGSYLLQYTHFHFHFHFHSFKRTKRTLRHVFFSKIPLPLPSVSPKDFHHRRRLLPFHHHRSPASALRRSPSSTPPATTVGRFQIPRSPFLPRFSDPHTTPPRTIQPNNNEGESSNQGERTRNTINLKSAVIRDRDG